MVGAVVVLLLAASAAVVIHFRGAGKLCAGRTTRTGAGFELNRWPDRHGKECVGWTVEEPATFGSPDQATRAVLGKIIEENKKISEQPKAYVRIAVLMPMTPAPADTRAGGTVTTGAMTAEDIRASLEGAYAAQKHANSAQATELGDPTPLIQLVLANEGSDQTGWPAVVEQLGHLSGGEHPLVAATGLGISIPETQQAAQRLYELRIPSVGAVTTADDMVSPWFFKVSPSNHQYAAALRRVMDAQPQVRSGYLAFDRNVDNYTASLRTALTDTFNPKFRLDQHSRGFNGTKAPAVGTPAMFGGIVRDVCSLQPDVLFYGGRDRDLKPLIEALKARGRCQDPVRPLVIATGATGLTVTAEQADAAQVAVLDAAATDIDAWNRTAPGTPKDYPAFRTLFTKSLKMPETDLAGGYAVMHYDAVAAVVWAARGGGDTPDPDTDRVAAAAAVPTPSDVRDSMFGLPQAAIPGASGGIYFHELPPNGLWPAGKPVPIIRLGAALKSWAPTPLYKTVPSYKPVP